MFRWLPPLILSAITASAPGADKALDAFHSGNYEEAQAEYAKELAEAELAAERNQLQLNLGAAAYRIGDYEGAKHAFGEALLSKNQHIQETAHYNLGNALFQSGRSYITNDRKKAEEQWNSAIQHYQSTLELNDRHQRAAKNLQFVKKQLEILQEPPPENDQKDEDQKDEDQKDDRDQSQPPPPNDPSQDQNQPPPPSDPNQDQDTPPDDPNQGQNQPPGDDPNQQQPPPGQPPEPPEGQPDKPDKPDNRQPPPPQNGKPQPHDWSPSEARRILENNSDEDKEAKPAEMLQFSGDSFRNW